MTCRKAKTFLPLYAGGDLRPRPMAAVRAHVESCPSCRREAEEYRLALARVREEAGEERVPDWGGAEWAALMARVRRQAPGRERAFFPVRPRWASASALGALLGLAVLTLLFKDGTGRRPELTAAAEPSVVSLTMVSQETGLQVVWFLDRNFEWKGEKN